MRRVLAIMAIAVALLLISKDGSIDRAMAQTPPEEGTEVVTIHRDGTTVQTRVLKEATDPDTGRAARAGSVIITFSRGTGSAERDVATRFSGASRSEALSLPDSIRIQVPEAYVGQVLSFLRTLPWVESAEADLIVKTVATPNDPSFGSQWGMTKINAPTAWNTTTGSTNVRVAILDCGIFEPGSTTLAASDGQLGHPDLRANKVIDRMNFTTAATPDDFCNHGTHVAGITAANTNNGVGVAGVGYNVKLINGKVLGDNGSGSSTSIINGILWAANCTSSNVCGARRAEVINMSLGGAGTCPSSVQSAINIAHGNGLVVVAAAGNSNTDAAFWPAICNNVLSVSASTSTDTRASFSNFGSWVDVAAPGQSIYSSDYNGSYANFSGTSMASPHVAGLAALLMSLPEYSDNEAAIARIIATADDDALAGSANGRIDAAAAVGGSTPPPAGDFNLACNPTSLTVQQGQSGNTTCTITSLNSFNSSVGFSCTSLLSGVSCSASALTPPANGSADRTVTVNVGGSIPAGQDDFQIVAASGSLTKQANMTLNVTSAPVAADCGAPTITTMNDTSATGSGTASFSWGAVSGATQYTIQRQGTSSWSTITTTNGTSYSGSDASNDPDWRINVSQSNGSCTAPSAYTTFDPAPPPDLTAPTVTSTNPVNGATGQSLSGTTVQATFNEPMTSSSVTSSSNFTVSHGGGTVSGSRSYNSTTRTVTFTPSSALLANTTYTATLTTAAEDATGNNLESAYAWTFSTGTGPVSSGYKACGGNAASAGGDNNGYQSSASAACTDGGTYAIDTNSGTSDSTSCSNSGKDSHDFFNFGLSVPAGATVNGIQVRLDSWADSSSDGPKHCVEVSWNSGATWTAVKSTANLTTSQATRTLGSASDNWGRTWNASDFSNSNFRVRVTNVSSNTSRDFRLDFLAVQVTYTP